MASKAVAKAAGGVVEISKNHTLPALDGRPLLYDDGHVMALNGSGLLLFSATQFNVSLANVLISLQKHTLQSTGLSERIRRAFAIDPNRSSGVPLNPVFRNPAPGAYDPLSYNDPVTIPAGDIADNAYFKRDSRRAYPQTSVFGQPDVVSLLTVGSAASPKVDLIGEAGAKALVEAQAEGEKGGLAVFLQKKSPGEVKQDVFIGGLPPTPAGTAQAADGTWNVHKYEPKTEGSYPAE
ncbi:hypothetical protein ACHAP0_000189 [Verticillium nonalfalfae]